MQDHTCYGFPFQARVKKSSAFVKLWSGSRLFHPSDTLIAPAEIANSIPATKLEPIAST
jgi:hypothetical protein